MSEIAGSPLSVSGARLGDRHDQPAADGIVHDSWNVRPDLRRPTGDQRPDQVDAMSCYNSPRAAIRTAGRDNR